MSYERPRVYQDEQLRDLQRFVNGHFAHDTLRDVLDAGCGYTLPLDFPRSVRLVGLDESSEALAKNENIDAAIVGDVESHPFAVGEYDAILCWNVLEHLERPRRALANMARALRPGGMLIIGIPNLWSLKGMVTKLTPYRFHVWVYRTILGHEHAGTPGYGPYPTHLSRAIAPERLRRDAYALGLERVYARTYEVDLGLPRIVAVPWSVMTTIGRVVTLGAWRPAASDHIAVFRRRPADAPGGRTT